jgi:hypothetical protein
VIITTTTLFRKTYKKNKSTDYEAYRCGKDQKISKVSLFSLRSKLRRAPLGVSHPFPQRSRFAKPFPFHQKRVKYVSGKSPEVYE